MNDCVTVWANWAQILNWVYLVSFANFRYLFQVVDMNKIFSRVSVHLFKVEAANLAGNTVVFDAFSS